MRTNRYLAFVMSTALLSGGAIIGCDDRSDTNAVPQQTNRAMDRAGDNAQHAADRAGDKMQNAGERAGDAAQRAGENTKDAANRAADNTGQALERAGDKMQGDPATQPSNPR